LTRNTCTKGKLNRNNSPYYYFKFYKLHTIIAGIIIIFSVIKIQVNLFRKFWTQTSKQDVTLHKHKLYIDNKLRKDKTEVLNILNMKKGLKGFKLERKKTTKKGITRWFNQLRKNLYENSIYFALLVHRQEYRNELWDWNSAKYIEFLYKFFLSLWNHLVIPFFPNLIL
jgi:hypothetical protein